jgi:hypothetical protein
LESPREGLSNQDKYFSGYKPGFIFWVRAWPIRQISFRPTQYSSIAEFHYSVPLQAGFTTMPISSDLKQLPARRANSLEGGPGFQFKNKPAGGFMRFAKSTGSEYCMTYSNATA